MLAQNEMPPQCRPRHRILIVDDTRAIQQDFTKILSSTAASESDRDDAAFFGEDVALAPSDSYEVSSAYQGQEAFLLLKEACINKRPFSLAFLDVRMPPGWDGIETAVQ